MSLFKNLLEARAEDNLNDTLLRIARGIERQNELLEMLLPSPFADPRFNSLDKEIKVPGEETLRVYGTKEAYYDELKELHDDTQ